MVRTPELKNLEPLPVEPAATREVAERHRLLLETTDTGYVVLDEAGRVLDANAVYVRMTGREQLDEIRGRPVTEWTRPEDVARNTAELRRCLEAGTVRNLEIDYVAPDGRITPIEINATVRRTPGGVTILTVCRDVSERRRAEEALRNSEQRYRTTIDSMAEAVHVVDADLRIELINGTGARWLREVGIVAEVVGRRIFEVFPFLPERVRDEYRRVFAGEGPLITEEMSVVEGREVWTQTRKIPIAEGGRVVRVVTVMRDFTESVRAQEQRRQSEKMEALGQLASGVAHDFNNQLSAVLGYAELLARSPEGPQVREYAAMIAQVAARCADLTRQLLAFARKGSVRAEPVDVHALIEEVLALLGRTIDRRVALLTRLDAPRAITLGDPALLQNALLNLALNARDAMPQGGALSFATDIVAADAEAPAAPPWAEPGVRLRIRLSDTGVGMTEEVRRRLFEPFFTTKCPGRGTGMGLAAVYGTVSHHGGAVDVESEPGRGATFTILLPLAPLLGALAVAAPLEAPARGQGHVLMADDEPAVLHATAESLAALGYRVTACADGRAAIARYRESWREIDVVLLDVMMPALDGAAALAEMRRVNPGVRAVLYSGHPADGEVQRLVDGGAAFLQKPFTLAQLARAVAAAG